MSERRVFAGCACSYMEQERMNNMFFSCNVLSETLATYGLEKVIQNVPRMTASDGPSCFQRAYHGLDHNG